MDKYITIAEFAEIVGVSKQAVYKRIARDLEPYVKTIDGSKRISLAATALFQSSSPVDSNQCSQQEPEPGNVSYLLKLLESKDKIIAQQAEQIKDLQSQLFKQADSLTEILKTQTRLQENFQVLLGQQQKRLEGENSVEPVEQPQENIEQPVDSTQKKNSIFSRLFR